MPGRKTAKTAEPSPALGLRRVPTQIRAQKTVEHILATAVDLLSEVGLQGFNTNLLAERAGVKVPTVYRYFPNKLAVLEELSHRFVAEWNTWLDEEAIADPSADWRVVWASYIDVFVAGVTAVPAGLVIQSAMRSIPELRHIREADIRDFVARLARALRRRKPSMDARSSSAAADLLLTTAIAVFDQALTSAPRKRAQRVEELKTMQLAYLATLLDDPR